MQPSLGTGVSLYIFYPLLQYSLVPQLYAKYKCLCSFVTKSYQVSTNSAKCIQQFPYERDTWGVRQKLHKSPLKVVSPPFNIEYLLSVAFPFTSLRISFFLLLFCFYRYMRHNTIIAKYEYSYMHTSSFVNTMLKYMHTNIKPYIHAQIRT